VQITGNQPGWMKQAGFAQKGSYQQLDLLQNILQLQCLILKNTKAAVDTCIVLHINNGEIQMHASA
jgi:hypothetical protein